ncbi:MAG TPA: hypothetical protein VEJ47_04550 [Candidatus Eremiobacteraceae bacterium]|nr:hypothetical protein [Candidatus Eremiobacteraceae bacterium]
MQHPAEMMSLLEPPPEKSHKSQVLAVTIGLVVVVLAIVLYFTFRYYPEKKTVSEFFDALVAGNTDRAYELWKPTQSYRKDDFLADWGNSGYYGPVKSFKIMGATRHENSNAVAVSVVVSPYSPMPSSSDAEKSQKTKLVTLWVSPEDKSLSFPP